MDALIGETNTESHPRELHRLLSGYQDLVNQAFKLWTIGKPLSVLIEFLWTEHVYEPYSFFILVLNDISQLKIQTMRQRRHFFSTNMLS